VRCGNQNKMDKTKTDDARKHIPWRYNQLPLLRCMARQASDSNTCKNAPYMYRIKALSLVHFHCQNKLLLTKIFNQHIINTLIYSNMTSFFRFVNKRAIYRLGIISLAHAPVHVTDFPIVNVHVDELSSARIWHHKLCATLSANVNINCRLPIKVYYRICTLRHIRIEIIHESQNVFWVLICVGGY
jgi:hypothetical protein